MRAPMIESNMLEQRSSIAFTVSLNVCTADGVDWSRGLRPLQKWLPLWQPFPCSEGSPGELVRKISEPYVSQRSCMSEHSKCLLWLHIDHEGYLGSCFRLKKWSLGPKTRLGTCWCSSSEPAYHDTSLRSASSASSAQSACFNHFWSGRWSWQLF